MNLVKQYAKGCNSYAVLILHRSDGSLSHAYDYIETLEEAYMLAQYAMQHDRRLYDKWWQDDIVLIAPGSNRAIDRDETYYKTAQRLAEKYKAE